MIRAIVPSPTASRRRVGSAAQPTCHVFQVGPVHYAYDLNTQSLLRIEPALAGLLRTGRSASSEAHRALRRARREGLFLERRPCLVARPSPDPATVDQDLQHLVLSVTEECNLRCSYCLHGAGPGRVRPHGSRRMTAETARRAVRYYLARRDRSQPAAISFYGGEPLRNRGVIETVCRQVRGQPLGEEAVLAIDTNGFALDEDAIDLALRHRMHLQVSLDGPRAIHDRYRRDARGRPTFDRILDNLGRYLDRAPDRAADLARRIRFTATLAPPVDLAAVARFFAEFPLFRDRGLELQPRVTVNFADLAGMSWPRGLQARSGLPPVDDQVDRAEAEYLEAVRLGRRREIGPVHRALFEPGLIRMHHRSRAPLGERFAPGGNCRPGRRKLHVTPSGRLQPCERVAREVGIGSIAEGIRSSAVAELQSGFHAELAGRCDSCWALRLCGVCFAAASPRLDDEDVCRRMRKQIERNLALMARILELPRERRSWLDRTRIA